MTWQGLDIVRDLESPPTSLSIKDIESILAIVISQQNLPKQIVEFWPLLCLEIVLIFGVLMFILAMTLMIEVKVAC